jgi:histidine ammonia-lyase
VSTNPSARPQRDAARTRVVVGAAPLSIADVVAIARGEAEAVLSDDPAYRSRLEAGRRALEAALRDGRPVYGVTTGVGASQANVVPEAERKRVTQNLLRFHGVGTGRALDEEEAAAVLVARLASLARG